MNLRPRHFPRDESSDDKYRTNESKSKSVWKRRLNKELSQLTSYTQRLLFCRASKFDYAFLPIFLTMVWILLYLIIDSNTGISVDQRLSQSYLKEYYLQQLNKEKLMKLSEERVIQMRPGEHLDIIYALPYLDTNPVLGVEHLKTLQNIVKHSTVPLRFHFLTNRKSEAIVEEIMSRLDEPNEGQLKHSIHPLEDFVDKAEQSICPRLSSSKEFCQLLLSSLPPFLFPFVFEDMEQAVYLDHRITFTDDIGMLIHSLRRLESSHVREAIGVAPEQSNRYMRSFGTWQRINPSTRLGKPHSEEGKPGFNPSLMVLNLSKLRASKELKAFLNERKMGQLLKTFQYHITGTNIDIGDALNLFAADAEHLFLTLDCTWNRRSEDSLDTADKKFNVCDAKSKTRAWNGVPSLEKIHRDTMGESVAIVRASLDEV